MSVRIKIHRGTNQIGGTITEIATDKSRIFIDFGCELSVKPEQSTDKQMIEMLRSNPCDAILFTHYHGDHVGLMEYVPETVPMYIGHFARKVLIKIRQTLAGMNNQSNEERKKHKAFLDNILKNDERLINYCDGESFVVGKGKDIRVTPVFVDHSAYDAYMFIIEAEGKRIIHTGDFRTHGRFGKDFFKTLQQSLKGKGIDVLIMEGTMMSRMSEKVMTEIELQEQATKILADNKYAFLLCSSTNVDSLISFYKAAFDNRIPMITGTYVNSMLNLYKNKIGDKNNDPFLFKKAYRIESPDRVLDVLGGVTQPEYLKEHGFLMVINEKGGYEKHIERYWDCNPILIYSMWNGYLNEKNEDSYRPQLAQIVNRFPKVEYLHTSGHASVPDIEKMILTVAPQSAIIPIHTERPDEFRNLNIAEYADKIKCLSDGEEYTL